jgi:hypothetical protein
MRVFPTAAAATTVAVVPGETDRVGELQIINKLNKFV